MEFEITLYSDGTYDVREAGGGAGGIIVLLVIAAIFGDLFASFGLPVIAYFVYFKDNPNIFFALGESIPMLLTTAFMWFININLFAKFVLKKNIFKNMTVSLTFVNRFIRYMLMLSLFISMIINLAASEPEEPTALFGALFAYNFIFAIIELVILIKADKIGMKGLFSLLIAFVGGCIIGAIAMEIEVLKKAMFEIVILSILVLLEVSMVIFKKKHS